MSFDVASLFTGSNIVISPLLGAIIIGLYKLDKRLGALETVMDLLRQDMRLSLLERNNRGTNRHEPR